MIIGVSSTVITPPIGIPPGGNAREDDRSRGVHDDLRSNVLYIDNGKVRIVFVALDLLGILKQDCDEIKSIVESKTGIKRQNIIITATHTHSGPNVVNIFLHDKVKIKEIIDYRKVMIRKIASGILDAVNKSFNGYLGFGKGIDNRFSFNRRIILNSGKLAMVFENYDRNNIKGIAGPNGFPDVNVFKACDGTGKIRSLLINYTSHPAVVCGQDWLYSRDYINYLTVKIQNEYGKDVVVLFTNGSEGNIVAASPYMTFITGFDEAERVGDGIADTVISITNEINTKSSADINVVEDTIKLPIRNITRQMIDNANDILKIKNTKPHMHGLDPKIGAAELLDVARIKEKEYETVIQAVKIDDNCIVTFPGEVFLEYGLNVIHGSHFSKTMIFGLANDYVGYIPTKQAFNEGGYEVQTAFSSRFSENTGEILVKKCLNLIMKLFN